MCINDSIQPLVAGWGPVEQHGFNSIVAGGKERELEAEGGGELFAGLDDRGGVAVGEIGIVAEQIEAQAVAQNEADDRLGKAAICTAGDAQFDLLPAVRPMQLFPVGQEEPGMFDDRAAMAVPGCLRIEIEDLDWICSRPARILMQRRHCRQRPLETLATLEIAVLDRRRGDRRKITPADLLARSPTARISSTTKMSASTCAHTAKASRAYMPLEYCRTGRSMKWPIPANASIAGSRSAISTLVKPNTEALSSTFSRPVKSGLKPAP